MTPFGLVWPRLALLATFGSVGPFWPFLAPFDPVWPRLTLFGTIWHHLGLFGPAWPHLALLGHSSIFTSRYFKVPIRQGGRLFSINEEVICRINPANSDLFAGLIRQIVSYLQD